MGNLGLGLAGGLPRPPLYHRLRSQKAADVTHTLVPRGLCVCTFSCVQLFAISWTVARQAPLAMGFPRQEYWHGLPFPTPGDLADPGLNPRLPCLLCWQSDSLPLCYLGKPPRGLVHPYYVGPNVFQGWGQGEAPVLPWGASAWCLSTIVNMAFCSSEPSTAPPGLAVKLRILLWSLHTVPPSPPCPLCLLLSPSLILFQPHRPPCYSLGISS